MVVVPGPYPLRGRCRQVNGTLVAGRTSGPADPRSGPVTA
jgi:hypothetical protein